MTFRDFVANEKWIFAKTYAAFAPHEYVVRNKVNDKEAFDKAFDFIETYGMRMYYYKTAKTYLFIDGWFYWGGRDSVDDPTAVINRCRPEDYDIVFMKRGTQERAIQKELEEKKAKKNEQYKFVFGGFEDKKD